MPYWPRSFNLPSLLILRLWHLLHKTGCNVFAFSGLLTTFNFLHNIPCKICEKEKKREELQKLRILSKYVFPLRFAGVSASRPFPENIQTEFGNPRKAIFISMAGGSPTGSLPTPANESLMHNLYRYFSLSSW